MLDKYLAKGFFIIGNNSKHPSSLQYDVQLIIHSIGKLEADFVMAKNTAIYSVENTINKLHTQSDFYFIYKQDFYYDKQDEINELLGEYHVLLLKTLIVLH